MVSFYSVVGNEPEKPSPGVIAHEDSKLLSLPTEL